MKKAQTTLLLMLLMIAPLTMMGQKKIVQYGNFESWCTREIKESGLIGGKSKHIYSIGPNMNVGVNKAYTGNTPWSTSNAYAKVAGIVKASLSVTPDKSHDGSKCAKLETKIEELKVAGMVNIKVLVSGCIYWGKAYEPIDGVNKPYSHMNWGIPFTERPKALVLDYKSAMPNLGTITKCKAGSSSTYKGNDAQEVTFVLQKRWEDENGKVHALRVGTAMTHISKPTSGWVKNFSVPVIYGDASKSPNYKSYMKFGPNGVTYYTKNSKGKVVPILEEGWAEENETPTHAILIIKASVQEGFSGTVGNTLWVDNIALEY